MEKEPQKCVIKYTTIEDDTVYFKHLEGTFVSSWGRKRDAQIFNSKETAECIIRELEKRHPSRKKNELEFMEVE